MILEKEDILEFFRDLAQWMSERQTHAEVTIAGGSALVLQTQFRARASDIDLYIIEAAEDARPLTYKERTLLTAQIAEEFSIVDIKYSELMNEKFLRNRWDQVRKQVGPTLRLLDCDPDGLFFPLERPRQIHPSFYQSLDKCKNGVTITLAGLEEIFEGKTSRCKTSGSNLAYGKLQTDIDDIQALATLLGKNWDERPHANRLAGCRRPGMPAFHAPDATAELG